MRLLLDTNIIIRSAKGILGKQALGIIEDTSNLLYYSPVSIWEIVIKLQTGKLKPSLDAAETRRGLEGLGCRELPVTSRHALAVNVLSLIHKDPFDRILLAQAQVEGIYLLTADETVAKYPGEIIYIRK